MEEAKGIDIIRREALSIFSVLWAKKNASSSPSPSSSWTTKNDEDNPLNDTDKWVKMLRWEQQTVFEMMVLKYRSGNGREVVAKIIRI